MSNYNKMTKEELLGKINELESELDDLQCEKDSLDEAYYELECELADLTDDMTHNAIWDVEYFKFKLSTDGLLTPELDEYIENYMKFNNSKD